MTTPLDRIKKAIDESNVDELRNIIEKEDPDRNIDLNNVTDSGHTALMYCMTAPDNYGSANPRIFNYLLGLRNNEGLARIDKKKMIDGIDLFDLVSDYKVAPNVQYLRAMAIQKYFDEALAEEQSDEEANLRAALENFKRVDERQPNILWQQRSPVDTVPVDQAGVEYLKRYKQWADTQDMEYVIISIGSGGADSQQKPKFAYGENSGLTESQVITLNLDPVFREAKYSAVRSVQYAPIGVKKTTYPKTLGALSSAISGWISQGKKVVLIDSQFPGAYKSFYTDLIEPHLPHYGSHFTFVHSYSSFYPVFIYRQGFHEKGMSEKADIIEAIFNTAAHGATKEGDERASALARTRKVAEVYATMFDSLDELTIGDLFRGPGLTFPSIQQPGNSDELKEAKDEQYATYLKGYLTPGNREYAVILIGPNCYRHSLKFAREAQVDIFELDTHSNTKLDKYEFPKTYAAVAEAITGLIQQGKKVVLIDSRGNANPDSFNQLYPDFIQPHLNHLNSRFVYVHSHPNFNSVWTYQRAFYELDPAKRAEIINSNFSDDIAVEERSIRAGDLNNLRRGISVVGAEVERATGLIPSGIRDFTSSAASGAMAGASQAAGMLPSSLTGAASGVMTWAGRTTGLLFSRARSVTFPATAKAERAAEGFAVRYRSIDALLPVAGLFPEDAVQARPPVTAGNPFHHPPVAGGVGDAADVNNAEQGASLGRS